MSNRIINEWQTNGGIVILVVDSNYCGDDGYYKRSSLYKLYLRNKTTNHPDRIATWDYINNRFTNNNVYIPHQYLINNLEEIYEEAEKLIMIDYVLER